MQSPCEIHSMNSWLSGKKEASTNSQICKKNSVICSIFFSLEGKVTFSFYYLLHFLEQALAITWKSNVTIEVSLDTMN